MFKDPSTTSINAQVNQSHLEHAGMPGSWAAALAAQITSLDANYRIDQRDAVIATRAQAAGQSVQAIALSLLPT
jgi:hypothetical protein